MNKHKITKKSYYELSAWDLNEIIEKVYKVKNFNCSLEAASDLSKTHTVGPSRKYSHDPDTVQDAMNDGHCSVDTVYWILLDLWVRKEIPAGEYLIDHSW